MIYVFLEPPNMPNFGTNIETKHSTLWHMLQRFYNEQKIKTNKLKRLPFSKPTAQMVLKTQLATIRKMVPFLLHFLKFLDFSNEEHLMVMTSMVALGESTSPITISMGF